MSASREQSVSQCSSRASTPTRPTNQPTHPNQPTTTPPPRKKKKHTNLPNPSANYKHTDAMLQPTQPDATHTTSNLDNPYAHAKNKKIKQLNLIGALPPKSIQVIPNQRSPNHPEPTALQTTQNPPLSKTQNPPLSKTQNPPLSKTQNPKHTPRTLS